MSGRAITYLSGGVGGAKLALGLAQVLPADDLSIIANTGDDFDHLGLRICPDIDTLVYTLSGRANTAQGWGRTGETDSFMTAMRELGGPDWFFLGDHDLAMHVERTRRLNAGARLTEVTTHLASALGVGPRILPMTDQAAPTIINTVDGALPFQDYFVRLHAAPVVTGFALHGGVAVAPTVEVMAALDRPDMVIVGPSNPFISIDPILDLTGVCTRLKALKQTGTPIVCVSPIVGGDAIKGPTAKMFRELGETPSVGAIARRYRDIISHLVIDNQDRADASDLAELGLRITVTGTVMQTLDDRIALAEAVLAIGP
ncbi:MAG: 2-phospho-L-lactate transferase [Minwuia sp.]|nr:2-phospho-L-lactate transferase [Minwuia sp.]